MDQLVGMIDNVNSSEIVRTNEIKEFEAMIKAYAAETQRISAVQASMSPEQIQDIVMGTVHGMITSGDLRINANMIFRFYSENSLESNCWKFCLCFKKKETKMEPRYWPHKLGDFQCGFSCFRSFM